MGSLFFLDESLQEVTSAYLPLDVFLRPLRI